MILGRWAGHVEKDPQAVALVAPSGVWTRHRLAAHAAGLRSRLADGEESWTPNPRRSAAPTL